MSIHLHLGAHKTASTHIQATLRENAPRLAAAGVRWAPPSELRGLIGKGRRAAAQMAPLLSLRAHLAARRLSDWTDGDGLLIVSDENSLGQTTEIIASRALYPTAAARLRLWRKTARAHPLTIFLALRDYAPFFAGVHAQSIRGGAMRPLTRDEVMALAALPRRWPDVIADIRRALPGANLILWRFEDYRDLSAAIPARLTGIAGLKPFRRVSMSTPSAPAMEALFALSARMSDGVVTKGDYAHHRDTITGPRYMPFDQDQQARMAAAYAEDVARLRADPEIEFLEPHSVSRLN